MNKLSKGVKCQKCGNRLEEDAKRCHECLWRTNEQYKPHKRNFPGYLEGALFVAFVFFQLSEYFFKKNSEKINTASGNNDYDLLQFSFIIAAALLYVAIVYLLNLLNKKRNKLLNFAIKVIAVVISIFVAGSLFIKSMAFGTDTAWMHRSQTMYKINTITEVAEENSNLLAEIKDKNEKSKIELMALINEQNKLYEHYEDQPMTFETLEGNIRILTEGIVLLKKKKELFRDFYSQYLKLPAEYFASFGLTFNDVNKLLEKSDESTDVGIQLANLKIAIYQNAIKFKKGILEDSTVVDHQIDEGEKLKQHMDVIEKEYDALLKDLFMKFTGGFPDSVMSLALEDTKREYKDLGINLDEEIDELKTDQE